MATTNVKIENTKALLRQRPARNRIFIVGFIVLVMVVFGVLSIIGSHSRSKAPPSTASVTPPPNIESIPGTSKSRDYNALVARHNQEDLAHANQIGGSALPTLAGSNDNPLANPIGQPTAPDTVAKPAPASTAPMVAHLIQPPAQPAQPAQIVTQPVFNQQAYDETRSQALASAKAQMQGYLTAFKLGTPAQEFPYYGKTPRPPAGGQEDAAQGQGAGAGSGQGSQSAAATFVRAGTVIPAELLTPVNSDSPGPVLAEITSGPLAGARVLGSFSTENDSVVLKFSTISMPGYDHSFKVNVFAVDADTLSPGLATDVNHHYLQRFGLLAAAAFISGYGNAVQQQGNTVITSPLGGATVVQGKLSSKQIAESALGNVGQQVGNVVSQQASSIHDTVKVQDKNGQGVPIGLLFMSDF